MWQLLLSLNSLTGGEHTQFLSAVFTEGNSCCSAPKIKTVFFTGGSSSSEVEMLDLLSSAQVERRKRHTFPDQVCSC